MQVAFAAAFIGGLGLFAGDPTLPVAVRVVAEGLAWLLCVRGVPAVAPLAVLAIAALALTAHAPDVGARFVTVLHVLSAALWAGGILALVPLRPPEGWRSAEARLLIERFGRVAIVAFGITAMTGFFRATEELKDLSNLWSTGYGVALGAKVVGVGLLIAASAFWRRGWAPIWVQAFMVLLVVLATAALAVLSPPAPIVTTGVIG